MQNHHYGDTSVDNVALPHGVAILRDEWEYPVMSQYQQPSNESNFAPSRTMSSCEGGQGQAMLNTDPGYYQSSGHPSSYLPMRGEIMENLSMSAQFKDFKPIDPQTVSHCESVVDGSCAPGVYEIQPAFDHLQPGYLVYQKQQQYQPGQPQQYADPGYHWHMGMNMMHQQHQQHHVQAGQLAGQLAATSWDCPVKETGFGDFSFSSKLLDKTETSWGMSKDTFGQQTHIRGNDRPLMTDMYRQGVPSVPTCTKIWSRTDGAVEPTGLDMSFAYMNQDLRHANMMHHHQQQMMPPTNMQGADLSHGQNDPGAMMGSNKRAEILTTSYAGIPAHKPVEERSNPIKKFVKKKQLKGNNSQEDAAIERRRVQNREAQRRCRAKAKDQLMRMSRQGAPGPPVAQSVQGTTEVKSEVGGNVSGAKLK